MKLKYKLFALLACIGLFASCTDEAAINPGGKPGNEIEIPEGMSAIKLSFKGLGKASSYATSQAGSAAENQVDSVYLFLFDEVRLDTLVNVYKIVAPNVGVGIAGTQETLLVTEKSSAMNIVALANPADSMVTADWIPYIGVIDFDDFQLMTTLQSDSMPKPSLLMSALQNEPAFAIGTSTAAPSISFDFIRSVARIDILNRDSVGLNHEFELQRARLNGIPSTAYLHGDGTTPANAKPLSNLYWELLDDSDNSTGTMFSQLYMNPSDGVDVTLEIEGLYNGTAAKYSIPFNGKQILANHRYVVAIDSVNPITLIANIEIVDWDTDTIKFNPDNGVAPEVTATLPAGVSFKAGATGKADTLTATSTAKVLEFEVRSETVEPVFSTASEWVHLVSETPVSYSAGFAKRIVIRLDSTVFERGDLIHFVNPIKPTERTSYHIQQQNADISATANPLARFTKANLTTTWNNTNNGYDFGPDLIAETAGLAENYGALFQWGRKVAFENTAEAPTNISAATIPFANGASTTGTWITTNPWHTEAGNAADVWTKLAAGSTVDSDPCPTGYRVPTDSEYLAVIPNNVANGTYADATMKIVASEGTGWAAAYIGAGTDDDGASVLYAVKQNGTNEAYALRYRYFTDYFEITSVKIGTGLIVTATTPVELLKALPWEGAVTNAAQREVRYFPSAGHRASLGDAVNNSGITGFYWSVTANSATSAYILSIFSDYATRHSHSRSSGFSVRCIEN